MRPRFRLILNAILLGFAVASLTIYLAELHADAQPENRSIRDLQFMRLVRNS
jgi:hypothetical protein